MATFTLDARLPNGAYASDSGLTEQEVANARANAPKLGIEILNVFRDDEPLMSEADMVAAFQGGVLK
jgi:hypothetical protein